MLAQLLNLNVLQLKDVRSGIACRRSDGVEEKDRVFCVVFYSSSHVVVTPHSPKNIPTPTSKKHSSTVEKNHQDDATRPLPAKRGSFYHSRRNDVQIKSHQRHKKQSSTFDRQQPLLLLSFCGDVFPRRLVIHFGSSIFDIYDTIQGWV